MFADDIVLVAENVEEVNKRLDKWRLDLERNRLRINRNNKKYIEYNFGRRYQEEGMRGLPMIISGGVIGEVENLKYFGSFM